MAKSKRLIEKMPQAPIPAPIGAASVTSQTSQGTDYFIQGNPAYARMGTVRPKSHWPEFTGGCYSIDTQLYDLYEEMLAKDSHIFGMIQTRIASVISRPRKIVPASSDPVDQAICGFVRAAVESVAKPGFDGLLMSLLHAVPVGLSVVEIEWTRSIDGLKGTLAQIAADPDLSAPAAAISDAVVPVRFTHLHPSNFVFDRTGRMMLSKVRSLNSGKDNNEPLDPRRFIVMQYDPIYANPYGNGLLARLQWLYWFKKNAVSFWLRAAEKVASPTLMGTYPGAFSTEVRDQMLSMLRDLQNSSVAAKPDSWTVEILHKAAENGAFGEGLAGLCSFINGEISKAIAGSTLIANEGRATGSYALGKVHDEIRREKIEGDARLLMDVINRDLIRPLVDFNFGPSFRVPRFVIDTDSDEDREKLSKTLDTLIKAGVPVPLAHIYEKFNIPIPEQGERTLGYDDANLYQYHLQYGVLTVNEVRARLGLSNVPWGDMPANQVAQTPTQPAKTGENPDDSLIAAAGEDEADEDDPQELNEPSFIRRLARAFSRKKKLQPLNSRKPSAL